MDGSLMNNQRGACLPYFISIICLFIEENCDPIIVMIEICFWVIPYPTKIVSLYLLTSRSKHKCVLSKSDLKEFLKYQTLTIACQNSLNFLAKPSNGNPPY